MDRRIFDNKLYNYYIEQDDLYYDCMINEFEEKNFNNNYISQMDRRIFDNKLYNHYIEQDDLYYDCMINEFEEKLEEKNFNNNYISQYDYELNCLMLYDEIKSIYDSLDKMLSENCETLKFKITDIDNILMQILNSFNILYCYTDYEIDPHLECEIVNYIQNILSIIIESNKIKRNKVRYESLKLLLSSYIGSIYFINYGLLNYFKYQKVKNHEYYINRKKKVGFINVRKENTEKRKREISNLILKGYSNIAISKKLGISKQAVGKFIKKHKLRIIN